MRMCAPVVIACCLLASNAQAAKPGSWAQAFRTVRQHLHFYRGDRLERWSDRLALGPSTFDRTRSVADNLLEVAQSQGLHIDYATIKGRQVPRVHIELGQGRGTEKPLRAVLARIAGNTNEVNFKGSKPGNPTGHVAVRAGQGAFFDLTGTSGVGELPALAQWALRLVSGKDHLTLVRKRNYRRFVESRDPVKGDPRDVYFGMLFAAEPQEQLELAGLYDRRRSEVKEFRMGGGRVEDGIFNCAKYLSHEVPFWNQRGIASTGSALRMGATAKGSEHLEAILVLRMPDVTAQQVDRMGY